MLQGVDVDKGTSKKVDQKSRSEIKEDVPLFGSVEDYSNMSQADRDALTEAMMIKHKGWAGKALNG